jgi:excinuclease ABC subunit B
MSSDLFEDRFKLESEFSPKGDQPKAIEALVEGITKKARHQVLLGVTGSGKTFTMAKVIERINRPTLIIAHNKTLAAQLYTEFKSLFPKNAVRYFVSYYDYYQPEAYIPATDTYIEKDAKINDAIDMMRHQATYSLFTRRDVIIVASVSCIYGIGEPEYYGSMGIEISKEGKLERDQLLKRLVEILYERNDYDFHRGTFRVRGDTVEIFPAYEENLAIRVEFWGDEIERISKIDPFRGRVISLLNQVTIYPGSHYVTPRPSLNEAIERIREELKLCLRQFELEGKLLERERLENRTLYDLELLEQMGYCPGIENYSRHLAGRGEGEPPATLLDYFSSDYLIFIDESHQTIPQLNAMYQGDRSRKETLVKYGFRLPSALDNRPLTFQEFNQRANQIIYVSATPGDYEISQSQGKITEQIIRPTGLCDPEIKLRSARNQIDDLIKEIYQRIESKERVLVTTLTKRMAEELTEYLQELGIKARYLHSEIHTLKRVQIIRDLRKGIFDVLVGVNLLREGLDIPEVSLVAILDADKEGFLRSTRSLIQTCGRAARNLRGEVIMYADEVTKSMREAITETKRRQDIQRQYNKKYGVSPQTVKKAILDMAEMDYFPVAISSKEEKEPRTQEDLEKMITRLKEEMITCAENLEFERAAYLRDKLRKLGQLP